MGWRSINAATLASNDMASAIGFYEAMGLELTYGDAKSPFATLGLGGDDNTFHINLFKPETPVESSEAQRWGRFIVYVDDVDVIWQRAVDAGFSPEFKPRDAEWGERYFHIRDPTGHELSFAKKIDNHTFWKTKKLGKGKGKSEDGVAVALKLGGMHGPQFAATLAVGFLAGLAAAQAARL